VPTSLNTDACAMCHRAHTSASDAWTAARQDLNPLSNALLTIPALGVGDTALCYSCHGAEQLGSDTDVQSAFTSTSSHSLVPSSSVYGPPLKQCSSCHDSHGSNRTAEGTTYPALLRAFDTAGDAVFEGEQYCGACHADRVLDTFDGLDTWADTAHAREMTANPDGTRILCLNCHDAHGSPNPPSIRTSLTTPSAPATATILANDRTLCLGCHADPLNTYSGETSYTSGVHVSSSATIAIPGEWPARDLASEESSRAVGECQVCHAPMGRADGSGGTIPKMVDKRGRQLCDQCHRVGGPAEESVIASLAYPASRNDTELIAVWSPAEETVSFGEVAVWTGEVTTTVPAGLDGPRVFDTSGITGDAATGDVDGDGVADLVVADPTDGVLDLYRGDAVQGLRRSTLTIPSGLPAHLVIVADLVNELPGPVVPGPTKPEIAVITRDPVPPHASELYLYTYSGGVLSIIDIAPGAGVSLPVGNDASSLAVGDLVGSATADLVVTARADDEFRVFAEQTLGTLTQSGAAVATGADPRGASVGDIWGDNSGNEIVICNDVSTVSIFRGDGSVLGDVTASGLGLADYAHNSLVADALWAETPGTTSGAELVVALRTDPSTSTIAGTSSINVFRQASDGDGLDTGLGWPLSYSTGAGYESSTLAAGDLDADGREELVVGNAGTWSRTANRQAPSVQVFDSPAGSILSATPETLWSSGVEQASGTGTGSVLPVAPAVLVANLGPVGPSRHPGDAGTGSHVSTESADFSRHVTCADCHNVHETTATVQASPASIYGALRGAWGTAITNLTPGTGITYTPKHGATREYEVCLKCHSANSGWTNSRNIAAEVNPLNLSVHAIQEPSANASTPASTFTSVPAGTFVNSTSAWGKGSQLYCIDCHTNSDAAQAKGPHVSGDGGLLRAPYFGTLPSNSDLLCYTCHKYSVYASGADDSALGGSLFRDSDGVEPRMHRLHVTTAGFSCRSCHASHGAVSAYHLQGDGHSYSHSASGGTCSTGCHAPGLQDSYARLPVEKPDALSVPVYRVLSPAGGDLSSILTRDSAELVVGELDSGGEVASPTDGTVCAFETIIGFTGVGTLPQNVELYGRYPAIGGGHTLLVQARDYTQPADSPAGWTAIGTWTNSASNAAHVFPTTNPDFLSGGEMQIRILHSAPPSSDSHYLHLDSVWLNP
jgi:predicted CXXCH cytochrome family protein